MTKPYRPSNGTEGMMFMAKFCDRCQKEAAYRRNPNRTDGCSILCASMCYEVEDSGYPKEWIEDDQGPRCTAFRLPVKRIRKPRLDGGLFA